MFKLRCTVIVSETQYNISLDDRCTKHPRIMNQLKRCYHPILNSAATFYVQIADILPSTVPMILQNQK